MTQAYVVERIKMTIDQFYKNWNKHYVEENQLHFIGGVLQTALHLLPFNEYNSIKFYIFETYGYDPGGCTDNQINLEELNGGIL